MPITRQPHPASRDDALAECHRLQEENRRLRELLAKYGIESPKSPDHLSDQAVNEQTVLSTVSWESPASEKIALFRRLFRGRDDVYAVRWESSDGRSGYSPACIQDWAAIRAAKPTERKKIQRKTRTLLPLTDGVIRHHLTGKHTVGIYPLLADDTCWFLAVDFDKKSWQEDSQAFVAVCKQVAVPGALERSRSGNGGHFWIFFDRPVSAALARNLGSALLTRTMERRHELGLGSYDRLFPNQDTLPKGGFGNLIALPLQKHRREDGYSVFLDDHFNPHPDQWCFLSSIERMSGSQIDFVLRELAPQGDVMGVRRWPSEDDMPWTLPPSGKRDEQPIFGSLPSQVCIVRSNYLYIEKQGLAQAPALLNRLIRFAAFQNPEFYRAQAMRLSTFGKPRVISCAEDFPKYVALPRGCLQDVVQLLNELGLEAKVIDERFTGRPIAVAFAGTLRQLQQAAAESLLEFDEGLLCAPTAFGKTAIAAWLISKRCVNTLILVHRGQLLDQWRERLASFLDLPIESIGQIGGGSERITGWIDLAMVQSLYRKGEVKNLVADYGQVIVDECHHISAFSFEQVLKQVKARFLVGLTATPTRKDGHHPIIFMQCGPMRYFVSTRAKEKFVQQVIPRHTEFRLPTAFEGKSEATIQDVYSLLTQDRSRLKLIVSDVLRALELGCVPLVLTGRREQVDQLEAGLKTIIRKVVVLRGGMGKKQRKAVRDELAELAEGEPRVIVATGSCIGEGFDDPRLNTLFLAWPISWKGTLQQYVGRLHRHHVNKKIVRVYDYVDRYVPTLVRMFEKRVRGYKSLGYVIEDSSMVGTGPPEDLSEVMIGSFD